MEYIILMVFHFPVCICKERIVGQPWFVWGNVVIHIQYVTASLAPV